MPDFLASFFVVLAIEPALMYSSITTTRPSENDDDVELPGGGSKRVSSRT